MSPCCTSSDRARTRRARPRLVLSRHHRRRPPPLPTLVQDERVLVLSCLDVTAAAHHLCLCSYKTSAGLSSSRHRPSSDRARTKRVRPRLLFRRHRHRRRLSSCRCRCRHPPFLPALVQDECGLVSSCRRCLPPPLSALFQDERRLVLPYRLCPHSSKMSAGSSFHTVSARARTKRARLRLSFHCRCCLSSHCRRRLSRFADHCCLPYLPQSYKTSATSSCLVLSCLVLSCLVLSCLVLPLPPPLLFRRPLLSTISGRGRTRQVQFHLVLSCLVLSCLAAAAAAAHHLCLRSCLILIASSVIRYRWPHRMTTTLLATILLYQLISTQ